MQALEKRSAAMANSEKAEPIYRAFSSPRKLKLVIFFVTSMCNAKCRTCFYWEELNHRGDLTWEEISKLSSTMPQFTDLWLSGGEPFLRKELTAIVHLFYAQNGVRWVNLPTNGLLPERTAEWVARIMTESPELHLDLNVAVDGLYDMQDSIRAVPGNFAKTLKTLDLIQSCRCEFQGFRVNVNTVICAENFDHILEIAEFIKTQCQVDGHYFNVIRGNAKESGLKTIPAERLPALYRELYKIYSHYAPTILRRLTGIERRVGKMFYQGTLALHNKIQLQNIESPHPWPMPCTASETSVVIDYNGDVRACELRGKLANLREFGCDFSEFWCSQARTGEARSIVHDQCWCTHVCFIHDSLRHSKKAMLYDVPLSYLQSKVANWVS
ncbi:MAG TPA: radical SAM protein [Terriglobia bacterium]|nr:radical SAM protein [Terriglobia bacterium]